MWQEYGKSENLYKGMYEGHKEFLERTFHAYTLTSIVIFLLSTVAAVTVLDIYWTNTHSLHFGVDI